MNQIFGKQGPDAKFVVEANHKPLVSELNPSSILIPQIFAYSNVKFYPGLKLLEYQHDYTNTTTTYLCGLDEFDLTWIMNCKSQILKQNFEYYLKQIITPDLPWYLTPNNGRITNYFQIAIRGRSICQSLLWTISWFFLQPNNVTNIQFLINGQKIKNLISCQTDKKFNWMVDKKSKVFRKIWRYNQMINQWEDSVRNALEALVWLLNYMIECRDWKKSFN